MADRGGDDGRDATAGPEARPKGGSWPEDKPLPLTDAECAALVRGAMVRWRGTFDDFMLLPGRYEMIDGWIYVRR
jgi:hypothetical protein